MTLFYASDWPRCLLRWTDDSREWRELEMRASQPGYFVASFEVRCGRVTAVLSRAAGRCTA